jgi:hypothetical protein
MQRIIKVFVSIAITAQAMTHAIITPVRERHSAITIFLVRINTIVIMKMHA